MPIAYVSKPSTRALLSDMKTRWFNMPTASSSKSRVNPENYIILKCIYSDTPKPETSELWPRLLTCHLYKLQMTCHDVINFKSVVQEPRIEHLYMFLTEPKSQKVRAAANRE
ncbi:unnamed protein product [Ilex paraguariensis]|uniref:Uncharacterized protein n=1 Tax=Ilex paraguariensis TaxID=185542 RepID=A0ABC8T8N0_9AQUA